MDEMEDKIGAILNNPHLMQQIMSMAQAMNTPQSKQEAPKEALVPQKQESFPEIDLGMIQKLSGLAKQSGIDKREQTLLRALGAYLSIDRIRRLEKAMRAAKMAKMASSVLGPKGLTSLAGR